MKDEQGLLNFSENIKPIIERCRDGKRLSKYERLTIVEYYLEVLHFLANN